MQNSSLSKFEQKYSENEKVTDKFLNQNLVPQTKNRSIMKDPLQAAALGTAATGAVMTAESLAPGAITTGLVSGFTEATPGLVAATGFVGGGPFTIGVGLVVLTGVLYYRYRYEPNFKENVVKILSYINPLNILYTKLGFSLKDRKVQEASKLYETYLQISILKNVNYKDDIRKNIDEFFKDKQIYKRLAKKFVLTQTNWRRYNENNIFDAGTDIVSRIFFNFDEQSKIQKKLNKKGSLHEDFVKGKIKNYLGFKQIELEIEMFLEDENFKNVTQTLHNIITQKKEEVKEKLEKFILKKSLKEKLDELSKILTKTNNVERYKQILKELKEEFELNLLDEIEEVEKKLKEKVIQKLESAETEETAETEEAPARTEPTAESPQLAEIEKPPTEGEVEPPTGSPPVIDRQVESAISNAEDRAISNAEDRQDNKATGNQPVKERPERLFGKSKQAGGGLIEIDDIYDLDTNEDNFQQTGGKLTFNKESRSSSDRKFTTDNIDNFMEYFVIITYELKLEINKNISSGDIDNDIDNDNDNDSKSILQSFINKYLNILIGKKVDDDGLTDDDGVKEKYKKGIINPNFLQDKISSIGSYIILSEIIVKQILKDALNKVLYKGAEAESEKLKVIRFELIKDDLITILIEHFTNISTIKLDIMKPGFVNNLKEKFTSKFRSKLGLQQQEKELSEETQKELDYIFSPEFTDSKTIQNYKKQLRKIDDAIDDLYKNNNLTFTGVFNKIQNNKIFNNLELIANDSDDNGYIKIELDEKISVDKNITKNNDIKQIEELLTRLSDPTLKSTIEHAISGNSSTQQIQEIPALASIE